MIEAAAPAGTIRPTARDWDDAHYIRVATGRTPLTEAERASLGPVAELFPVFG